MLGDLAFRQIHLDFHTSEHIRDVAVNFDPDQFADTLVKANVNSITCFARCHHGWMYYDSMRFPERVHPHLQRRHLLKEQIEACHRRNIRVPIYVTVQWDQFTADQHPEWRVVTPEGKLEGRAPYEAGFYRRLCLNTPYVELLGQMVREILETLPTDGLFFDIVAPMDCSCRWCREGMAKAKIDPSNAAARQAFGRRVETQFMKSMTGLVRQFSEDCTIFYNAGHVGPRHQEILRYYSHLELESLPTGGWGYLHFPLTARYARTMGAQFLGMTGKFHTTWGDFHSFKYPAALQYECFLMLALGGRCSVGDQLPPSGMLCPQTYQLIGPVYGSVKAKEPWCTDTEPVADIAVFTPEALTKQSGHGSLPRSAMGAVRILQESQHQFDIVDDTTPWQHYKLLILPDEIVLTPALAERIERYVAAGGRLLASHRSGLDEAEKRCLLRCLGVTDQGPGEFEPSFLKPAGVLARKLTPVEHVMYLRGRQVETAGVVEVLADNVAPHFNRTWEHYCSHQHAPSSGRVIAPGIVRTDRAIYFAHPVFTQYQECAPHWVKQMVLAALDLLLPEPAVRVAGPSSLQAMLNRQPGKRRDVLHLLHYIPERKCDRIDIVEDVIPLHDVEVSLRCDREVASVRCVPEGPELAMELKGQRIGFTVPTVAGHQMVEIRWGK